MTKIVITALVENAEKWEQNFRTHADLFRSQTVESPMSFAITGKNEIAIYAEAKNHDKFMEILGSKETADAMATDGVKRETVKVYRLDKELQL